MNKFKISSFAVLLAVVLITSCKDEDESPSRSAILIGETWTLTKVELKINGTTTDYSSFFLEDCDADNTITFQENGTYNENTGADDCDGDDENSTGTWALSDNDNKLTITIDGSAETWTIKSIDSSKIVIESPEETEDFDGDGDEENVSVIFTATAK